MTCYENVGRVREDVTRKLLPATHDTATQHTASDVKKNLRPIYAF